MECMSFQWRGQEQLPDGRMRVRLEGQSRSGDLHQITVDMPEIGLALTRDIIEGKHGGNIPPFDIVSYSTKRMFPIPQKPILSE